VPSVLLLALAAAAALLPAPGCDTDPERRWPWSTPEDTAAAEAELARWRAVFDPSPVLAETLRLGISAGLATPDSSSPDGETLYKFAHVIDAWYEPDSMLHSNDLQFDVTADSGVRTDTFCQVRAYRDSMTECRMHFAYDSLWVVGYRPETIIDTTRTPWDTTITFKASSVDLRGYGSPQSGGKAFGWVVKRQLFMRKVDSLYELKKVAGFRATMPTADDAPATSSVVVVLPGRTDTFKYNATPGGRQVNNLWPVDSLYSLRAGEQFTVGLSATTPEDTVADANRFYVLLNGRRTDITAGRKRGEGVVSFAAADTGYQHICVEILPWRNLLYPDAAYCATVWAIPVYVTPQEAP